MVELGGEKAENLNDVANKMGTMVGQYKKIAKLDYTLSPIRLFGNKISSSNANSTINWNLDFNPEIVVIFFHTTDKLEPNISGIVEDAQYKMFPSALQNYDNEFYVSDNVSYGGTMYRGRATFDKKTLKLQRISGPMGTQSTVYIHQILVLGN